MKKEDSGIMLKDRKKDIIWESLSTIKAREMSLVRQAETRLRNAKKRLHSVESALSEYQKKFQRTIWDKIE